MTLTRRFNLEQTNHPEFSTLVNFIRSIPQSDTTKKEIIKQFYVLVNKRDYSKSEEKGLLEYLIMLE